MRLILCLLALQLVVAFSGPPTQSQTYTQTTGANWLSALSDDTALQTLHIPGTHNSAAHHELILGTAKCQSLSIEQQLQAGVRFFDIRCRHQNDGFELYHGVVDQKQTFGELQRTLTDFLKINTRELILISIQETSQPLNNTRSFSETFLHYQKLAPELWSTVSTVPTLDQVRGKAVLVRRFSSPKALGIPATNWKSGNVHRTKLLLIQDDFKVRKLETKWARIEELWKQQPQHSELLALNFTSGYRPGVLGVPNITAVCNRINPRLQTKLNSNTAPPPGILVIDHLTEELATAIYQLNLETPKPTPGKQVEESK